MTFTFTARILPTFTAEPSLVGELVAIDPTDYRPDGSAVATLLGDSEYIRTRTDGHVLVKADEIEPAQFARHYGLDERGPCLGLAEWSVADLRHAHNLVRPGTEYEARLRAAMIRRGMTI